MNDQSIGIMQGAFFVSKGDILNWINQVLRLNLTRIEQLGTGAAYCQLLDMISPGSIKIAKINWRARNQWQFLDNLKLLQNGFQKCGIKKHIEMQKLSKAKYQDNLQFAQWFKRFYDLNPPKSEYDPAHRRNNVQIDFSFLEKREVRKGRRFSKSKSPQKLNLKNFSLNKHQRSTSILEAAIEEIDVVLKSQMVESEKLKRISQLLKVRMTQRENTQMS